MEYRYVAGKGLFIWYDSDSDLFITTNGFLCCRNLTVWTLKLHSIQLISCKKEIAGTIAPCEQALIWGFPFIVRRFWSTPQFLNFWLTKAGNET